MKIDKAFQLAYQYYQAGDLNQARNVYKKILRFKPRNIDVLRFLGGICYQLGDFDDAIRYIKKEIEITPSNADAYNNLGLALQAKGLLAEAIDYFRKAITLKPSFPEAHYNLGFAFQNTGQLDEAISFYRKAIQIAPGLMGAYNNLGILLRNKGNLEESITYLQQAIRINPHYANIHNNLGLSLQNKGNIDEAIVNYQKAINLNPAFADAYNNLGIIFKEKGQIDEAITCYQKAVHLNPDLAEAYINLGAAFIQKDEREKAITCYQKAIEKRPNFADAYYNLGVVVKDKGQFEESIQYYQKALLIEPNHADSHWNLSHCLLLLGNFKEGWREYEWRLKLKSLIKPEFDQPLWDGSDITGRTVLLYSEQGFGDAIQFIRYAHVVAQQNAKIIIKCHTELITLFQNVKGIYQIIAQGEQLPPFDVHCPFMSLPFIFGTTLDTIPADIPYIKANTALVQKWKDKIKDDDSKLRVGLSWAGRPSHRNDSNRSFPLETLAPLAQADGVVFYSLQKGNGSEQAKNPPKDMRLVDYADEIQDFSDTAALIENLDLVISVDTAVAHLAGALGKPVWTLIPFAPDWRWMLKKEDSPWYPTMRLFRQPALGDWKSVIVKVANELENKIKEIEA